MPPSSRIARTLEDPIAQGDRVSLQYKGTQLFVIVTRVVAPQETYEGRVQGFVMPEPVFEVEDLKRDASSASAMTILGALNEARRLKENPATAHYARRGSGPVALPEEVECSGAARATLPAVSAFAGAGRPDQQDVRHTRLACMPGAAVLRNAHAPPWTASVNARYRKLEAPDVVAR